MQVAGCTLAVLMSCTVSSRSRRQVVPSGAAPRHARLSSWAAQHSHAGVDTREPALAALAEHHRPHIQPCSVRAQLYMIGNEEDFDGTDPGDSEGAEPYTPSQALGAGIWGINRAEPVRVPVGQGQRGLGR